MKIITCIVEKDNNRREIFKKYFGEFHFKILFLSSVSEISSDNISLYQLIIISEELSENQFSEIQQKAPTSVFAMFGTEPIEDLPGEQSFYIPEFEELSVEFLVEYLSPFLDKHFGYNFSSRTIESIVSRNKKLSSLLDIANKLNSETKLDSLLNMIVKLSAEILDAERASLFLIDYEKKELWSIIALGLNLKEIRFPISKGISGHVAQTGETLIIDDPYNHPHFNKEMDITTGYVTKNILCMPVRNQERKIIGVFQILNKKNGIFNDEDIELLGGFSSNAAVAIENAQLHQEKERQFNELQAAYQDLKSAQETIINQEKLATIGQFSSGIAHEVKNQLTIVSAVSAIKKRYPEDEKIVRYTNLILEAQKRIVNLLDEIRDFAKKKEFDMENCSLKDIAVNVIELCRFDKDLNKIKLQLQYEDTEDLIIYANADKLKQVLINLLRNAGHASESGQTVFVNIKSDSENIIIKVIDNGSGMNEEIFNKIWVPFFTTKKNGTGLGLDICRNIIESHKGTIWAKTKIGEGSIFYIKLPKKIQ